MSSSARLVRSSERDVVTLADLGEILIGLTVGQQMELPHDVFDLLFLNSAPDKGARARALEFAESHGCPINHQTLAGVVFVREVVSRLRLAPGGRARYQRCPR
jgi:hypothetical protein